MSPWLALLMSGLLLLTACKGGKEGRRRFTGKADASELLSRSDSLQVDFKFAAIRGKGDFSSPDQSLGFTYRITIAKDSLIWMQMTKFGIEGLRALIDPNTIQLRIPDRKEHIVCDFRLLSKMTGFKTDFSMLQDLLLGNTHFITKKPSPAEGDPENIKFEEKESRVEFEHYLDKALARITKLHVTDAVTDKESMISFSDFQPVDSYTIPHSMDLQLIRPTETSLNFRHSTIELEPDNPRFSFKISDSYERKDCPVDK